MEEVAEWDGWGSDDQGHHVHVHAAGTRQEIASQVVARVLAKYGARTDTRAWRFWLQSDQNGRREVVPFRPDENGSPIFL